MLKFQTALAFIVNILVMTSSSFAAAGNGPINFGSDFNEGYILTQGAFPVRLHYVTAGDPSKNTIVLVHGFPQFSYMWKKHMELLKDDFFVIAPDLRGYGQSDKPQGVDNYKIDILARDLKQLIEKIGHGNITLVAHDWGGLVAHALAIKYPAKIKKLIIINAPHPKILEAQLNEPSDLGENQRRAMDYVITLRTPGIENLFAQKPDALEQALYYNDPNATVFTTEDRAVYRNNWTLESLTASLNYYRASELGPPDFWQKNGGVEKFPLQSNYLPGLSSYQLTMPVLYIWGDKDQHLFPTLLEGIHAFGGQVTVMHIPEGTHWVANEFPEEISQHISQFAKGSK